MKAFLWVASVLVGASGIVQMMPAADRLAQRRPQRIAPRAQPPGVPVRVGDNGPADPDPARCIAACDRTMRGCIERCPREGSGNRTCMRVCFTTMTQCYATCPDDAGAAVFDASADQGPVLHTIPRR